MAKPIRKPRDWSQRALSVVQQAVGEIPKQFPPEKNPTAIRRGHLGGIKGGVSRSKKLSPRRKRQIARRAARSRWLSK